MKHRGFRWSAWLLLLVLLLSLPVGASSQESSDWAAAEVAAAREAGLVPEKLAGNYEAPITRAEFCALAAQLYRVWDEAGQTAEKTPQNVAFTDCTDADVLLCASLGVVNGVGDGKFNPGAPIRRQDAAAMLYRLAALRKGFDDTPVLSHVFDDGADLRSWARGHVYWVYAKGIMQGTGDNCFTPDGLYTREQSILTMLRLWNHTYAAVPEETPEPPYHVVWDFTGMEYTEAHLEDPEGNRLFTDLEDSGGTFRSITIFGDVLGLAWDDYNRTALYVPKTGTLIEGWKIVSTDEAAGVGWCRRNGLDTTRTVLHDDGTLGGTYTAVGEWQNGQVLVWSSERAISCMDASERVLWTCPMPGTRDTLICQGDGGRAVVQNTAGQFWLLSDGSLRTIPAFTAFYLPRWSTNYILGNNGYYTLYDRYGKTLYGPFPNIMDEVGQDLYIRWIDDNHYEYFRCVPGGTPVVLFTVYTVGGYPDDLPTDGAGVYALRTDTREITCFDRFGDTLGVIETEFNLDVYTDISFENGCVRVKHTYATEDAPVQSALYLPTGEKIG